LLEECRVDIDSRTGSGETAFVLACCFGHAKLALYLADSGCSTLPRFNDGILPMEYARKGGWELALRDKYHAIKRRIAMFALQVNNHTKEEYDNTLTRNVMNKLSDRVASARVSSAASAASRGGSSSSTTTPRKAPAPFGLSRDKLHSAGRDSNSTSRSETPAEHVTVETLEGQVLGAISSDAKSKILFGEDSGVEIVVMEDDDFARRKQRIRPWIPDHALERIVYYYFVPHISGMEARKDAVESVMTQVRNRRREKARLAKDHAAKLAAEELMDRVKAKYMAKDKQPERAGSPLPALSPTGGPED